MKPILAVYVAFVLALPALADPKDGPVLKPGMKAFSYKFTPDGSIAFVLPGCKVDVLVAFKDGDKQRVEEVVTQVLVIAVDEPVEAELKAHTIVCTLEVSAKDAEKLTAARKKGTLKLVLRRPSDDDKPASPPQKDHP